MPQSHRSGTRSLAVSLLLAGLCAGAPARAAPPLPAASAGDLTLDVDLREAPRRLLHAKMTLPVRPGPLVLVYPKWIPGEHGPTGPIKDVAGLVFTAGDRPVAWRRDPVDMYRFLLDIPAGASSLRVQLDFLSPPPHAAGFSGGASATDNLTLLSWNQVLLYPEGASPRELRVHASVQLPGGWKLGTALPAEKTSGGQTVFRPVSLEMLIDSPVLAGAHFQEYAIGPAGGPRHFLDVAAETEAETHLPPELKASYDRLVSEAAALFGATHYESYHFLLTLSDSVAHFGLEHHQSSDDRVGERLFSDKDQQIYNATLLPHEFVHSWNGKHRRPAGLATPDYQQPMRGELLWVYEGLTDYLGRVLATRSGLWTPDQARENFAVTASNMRVHRGRTWRPLEDTAVAAQLLYEARGDWQAWRRGVDFYPEGDLLWLEVDGLLRDLTHGRSSMDDFCHRFHGGQSGRPSVRPYGLEEVISTLQGIAPHDWRGFFEERVRRTNTDAPLRGFALTGWRLAYSTEPTAYQQAAERTDHEADFSPSLGISLDARSAFVSDVIPGSPADRAGLSPGMKILAINQRRFSPEMMHDALEQARATGALELLLESGDSFLSRKLEVRSVDSYPRLERDTAHPDAFGDIVRPHAAARSR